jgi:two-component system OmpR family response regulator
MEPKRILVVDDESGFTRLLKLTLEKTGNYRVREENDGTQALQTARQFKPDLILLDVIMPKADGGDVARKFAADPLLKDTPVIFLTAILSKREATPGALIEGRPCMAKPVSLNALIECIEKNLAAPGSEQQPCQD